MIVWGLILSMTSNSVFKLIIWLEICFIFGSFTYTLSKFFSSFFLIFFIYKLMFSHVYSHQNEVLNLKILHDFKTYMLAKVRSNMTIDKLDIK